jgi:glutaredoxin-related protein
MVRPILAESNIQPAVRDAISTYHTDIVKEVQDAITGTAVVVVGMALNPMPKRARQSLDAAGIKYKYLEYVSYINNWRRRNALKMWTGWPTFSMAFVNGTSVGGADDVKKLIDSGALKKMLA